MRQKGARRGNQQRRTERSTNEKIQRLLQEIEGRMESVAAKARLADYTRLIELEHELEEGEGTTEIKVTWVEPTKAENSEE